MNSPRVPQIETTSVCNAHCIFCPHDRIESIGTMSDELYLKIITEASGLELICFIPMLTGEPLGPWPSRNSRMNHAQPKGRRNPPLVGLNASTTALSLFPELLVPLSVLLPRYFSIFGGGVKAGMSQVLLEKPEPIAGIVQFHRMDGKGIPEFVGTYPVRPTSFWVNQIGKASSLGTVPHHLPGPMSIDTEYELATASVDRPATPDVIL